MVKTSSPISPLLPSNVSHSLNNATTELSNSTWKSFLVAEGVSPYSKLWPAYISNDHELDLFVYEYERNVSWISNVRGASA